MKAPADTANPFGLGTAIFGQPEPEEPKGEDEAGHTESNKADGEASDDSDSDEQDEDDSLVTAMATASLDSSAWASVPAYDVLYLSTIAEYLPPAPKPKIPKEVQINEDDIEAEGRSKDATWASEGYENSLDIDHAFERFSKRVACEGEQCLRYAVIFHIASTALIITYRYELGGTPLPFASDKVFDRLFPVPPKPNLPVTRPTSMVVPPAKRTYDPSSIPTCPHCHGRRVFECQLMPNLINVLKKADENKGKEKEKQSDEARRKEIEKQLKSSADVEKVGMEWGTCFVFSCEKDCCVEAGTDLKSCWREEVVLVQWDV